MNDERRLQADALRHELRRLMTERLQRRLLPFEGRWLDAADVAQEQRRARRRAWVTLFEVLLLFALMGGLSWLLISFLDTLAY